MRKIVGLSLLVVMTAACGSMARKSQIPGSDLKAVAETVYLGIGYDTDAFGTRDACVEGEERLETQPQADWNFKRVENWDIVKREMGFSVEGQYTYGLAQVTSKSSFTRNLQDTDLTSTYMLTADYIDSTRFLNNAHLSQKWLDLANSGEEGMGQVRRRCGNSYVSQIDAGGMLRVMVKFRFKDKSVKEKFNFQASVTYGANSVTTNIDKLSESELRNSSAEIFIHQEGGDLSNMGQILDPAASVECNLDYWEQCQNLIKKIMEYSIGPFPADVKAGGIRVFSYKTSTFFEPEYPLLSQEVQDKRMAAIFEMEKQDYDLVRIRYLLKDRDTYTLDERRRELDNLRELINRNVLKLTSNLRGCVEFPNNPLKCVSNDDLRLESYDQSRLLLGSQKIVGPSMGGTDGEPFEQVCRNFMQGALGTQGAIIDQLSIVCDDSRLLSTGATNQGKYYYNKACEAGQVVTGIRGSRGPKQGIRNLTFTCTNLAEMRAKATSPTKSEFVLGIGGGNALAWNCPAGMAAVGFQGRSNKYLNAVSLICVNY